MKIVILGGDGMLGHQLVQQWATNHQVVATFRKPLQVYKPSDLSVPHKSYYDIRAEDFASIVHVVEREVPDVVVNAIGVIKQRADSHDAITSIEINALLPHRLAELCRRSHSRLVHLSTDCVFSGTRGMYTEDDHEDAQDLYGRTKLLGEVRTHPAITLRTSIIGLELERRTSLIEWFLAQEGRIRGFSRAIYSGFTTVEMARIIERVLIHFPTRAGIYNVSSEPIDKYTLLTKLRDRLHREIIIERDDEFVCDRSLDSSRFRREFAYQPPSWDVMLDELAAQVKVRETRRCE